MVEQACIIIPTSPRPPICSRKIIILTRYAAGQVYEFTSQCQMAFQTPFSHFGLKWKILIRHNVIFLKSFITWLNRPKYENGKDTREWSFVVLKNITYFSELSPFGNDRFDGTSVTWRFSCLLLNAFWISLSNFSSNPVSSSPVSIATSSRV